MKNRREQILDAALEVFLEKGFDGATLAAIRQRSGASTGSIYHFFSGKADIAAALLSHATTGWAAQSGSQADPSDAEGSITSSVHGFLHWGAANPKQFAFMDELLTRSGTSPDFEAVGEMLAAGRARAGELYQSWVQMGSVRDLNWDVAYALIMGPAYALLRSATKGKPVSDLEIDVVVRAAWTAVRTAS